jgi:peptidyl-prolyl cis-trans isomerase C
MAASSWTIAALPLQSPSAHHARRFSGASEIVMYSTIRAGLCAGLLFAAPAFAQTPQAVDTASDPVIAIVDGAPVRRSDMIGIQRTLPDQFRQMPFETLFPMLLERMIDAKLIANAGRKEQIQNDAEVRSRVTSYEERVIQEVYLTRRLTAAMTDEALRKRYEQFAKDNPAEEEVRARHILVPTEARAKEIIAELKKGGDFAKLAAQHTTDPSGRSNGGDLGFFKRGEMVPEFAEAAFKLKDGEITDAPVKSQFGWHIIKTEGRRKQAPSFEEARERLSEELQQEIVSSEVKKLREAAKVERFNPDGSPRRP